MNDQTIKRSITTSEAILSGLGMILLLITGIEFFEPSNDSNYVLSVGITWSALSAAVAELLSCFKRKSFIASLQTAFSAMSVLAIIAISLLPQTFNQALQFLSHYNLLLALLTTSLLIISLFIKDRESRLATINIASEKSHAASAPAVSRQEIIDRLKPHDQFLSTLPGQIIATENLKEIDLAVKWLAKKLKLNDFESDIHFSMVREHIPGFKMDGNSLTAFQYVQIRESYTAILSGNLVFAYHELCEFIINEHYDPDKPITTLERTFIALWEEQYERTLDSLKSQGK